MFRTILAVLTFSAVASAATITFVTPVGATSAGGAVNASATFATIANTLTITLTDLQNNPGNVGQLLSDLAFVVSTGQTTGSLTSSSGVARTVASNGSFADGGTVAAGWVLQAGFTLCDLCGGAAGPTHTIIGGPNGSNVYAAANSSIAGNGPHNPFLAGPVTFVLNIPGITATSTISSATFSFGTTEGDNVQGCVGAVGAVGCNPTVPEPITSGLVGTGLIGLFFLRRRVDTRKV